MQLTRYQRFLPHQLGAGETYFITFRLAGTLPREVIERLLEERELELRRTAEPSGTPHKKAFFKTFDSVLDGATHGLCYLTAPAEAEIVKASLHFLDGPGFELLVYCLMPNHVHLVAHLPADAVAPLARTLQRLKSHTARYLNRLRNASGRVWHRESYDHRVRNAAELDRIVAYVLNNPVKAGLAKTWPEWPHHFWRDA